MKHFHSIPLITIFYLCFAANCEAQTYVSIFGTENTSWKIPFCNLDIFDVTEQVSNSEITYNSYVYKKIGTSTIQSRTTAGTKSGKYIFCLPGSPSACKDAWEEILKFQLDIRHKPCNFVEIMPRLNEALKV